MSYDPTPSSPSLVTDTEDSLSYSLSSSVNTVRVNPGQHCEISEPDGNQAPLTYKSIMPESDHEQSTYGTPVHKFSKDMMNSLSKYKLSEDLTNSNFPTWSQSIKEVFISMRLDKFIKVEGYSDPNLSSELNEVTSFNITMFILNRLDEHNNTQTRNHLTDPDDPSEMIYDPYKCWQFLQIRHNEITEDKLTAVTKALHKCKILKNDSLSSYLDKF